MVTVAAWLIIVLHCTNGHSNEGHGHFADTMEEALRLPAPTENKQQVNVTAVKQVLVNVDPITTSMTNHFAGLEVESPEEEHEVTSMVSRESCCAQQTGMHKPGCGSTAYCYLPD
jgi:hypothetical protein